MHIKATIGEIEISPRTKIVVNLVDIGGKDKLDIRTFFQDYTTKEWHATKKGVSFYHTLTPVLIKILNNSLNN